MTVQEQAFRSYYSLLSDAELRKIEANQQSYIAAAREALASELQRRQLVPATPEAEEAPASKRN